MASLSTQKRSRGGIINYINKLINVDIKNIYESQWEESKLLQLMSYKDIIQNKLEKVVQLNEEIGEKITDDTEFEVDMEKAGADTNPVKPGN